MNEVMSNQPAEHIASGRSCTQVTHEEHAHASARGEGAERALRERGAGGYHGIQVASGRGWGGWRRYCEEEWPVAEAVDGAVAASLICWPVDEVEPGGGADWERPT